MANGERDNRDDKLRQATWAGCFLALLSVVTTLGLCLAIGAEFFGWVVSKLPKESLVELRIVKLVLGVVIYGSLIAPGLLVFWLGEKLFAALSIRVWQESKENDDGQK